MYSIDTEAIIPSHMPKLALTLIVFFSQPILAADLQEFTANYQINFGDIELGTANYRFSHTGDSEYLFDFSSDLRFLVFWDEREVKTELVLEGSRLVPRYYSHDREGTGRDYLEEIAFDSSEAVIRTTYLKETQEFDYEKGVVDGLTVQLQMALDLQQGAKQLRYKIIDSNRIREREFQLVGEETITIQGEDCHTVIYEVVRDNNKRKTRMWFSTERNYLPVQMVHFTKGKKRFNAHLVNYSEHDSSSLPANL